MRKLSWLFGHITVPFIITIIFPFPLKSEKHLASSINEIRSHVEFLADDALEGRGTGTRGGKAAANYISDRFEEIGLQPVGDQRSYFQSIPMLGNIPLANSKLTIYREEHSQDFVLGKDYLLYKMGSQTFVPRPVPMVFVGYGIVAPEFDYNDYQWVDVSDKIVVFLSGEPPSFDSDYFNGTLPTIYSYPEAKQRLALSRGAKGSIIIPTPRDYAGHNWTFWQNEFAFEHVTLFYRPASSLSVLINPDAAEWIFESAEFSLQEIFKEESEGRIKSFELPCRLSFHGEFKQREFLADNVVGVVPGTDSKQRDTYVLISAHYDHLGIGPEVQGDSIYNGVQDNAIGVSVLIQIAKNWKANPTRRSAIFLATTGEEKGLLGSSYYAVHPSVPLYKTIAAVNIDGVAVSDVFSNVVAVGGEYSDLGRLLNDVAASKGLKSKIASSMRDLKEQFSRSDQVAFAEAGIPSVLLVNGMDLDQASQSNPKGLNEHLRTENYHSPFDDLNQPINWETVARHFDLIRDYCRMLGNIQKEPEWFPGTPYLQIRLQSKAQRR
jgi:hypothetical protein